MFLAVIPAQNEAHNLKKIIYKLQASDLDLIVPVLNGCSDDSLLVLQSIRCPKLAPLCFTEALGIDVPRAVGAIYARQQKANGVLFIDGDMVGADQAILQQLIQTVKQGVDLALTNCYPLHQSPQPSLTAASLIQKRICLNRQLGLFEQIGSATPSHGPHAVSAALLKYARPQDFVVPPMLLLKAVKAGLKVAIGAEIPHLALGSPWRSSRHAQKIFETIMGDYLLALHNHNLSHGTRSMGGKEYIGYHHQRRLDLLHLFEQGQITGACYTKHKTPAV